jgi:hypothetical protein
MRAEDWFEYIKKIIREIADEDYQRSTWISGKNPEEMSTWDEFLCVLFDDYNFDDFIDGTFWKDAGLRKEQHSLLLSLRSSMNDASEQLGDEPDPEDVLLNLAWKEAIFMAKEFIKTVGD